MPPDKEESTTSMVIQRTRGPVKGMERCKVCDCSAAGRHYGTTVCGSCACCRHCRFKNCLKAGMDARVVQVRKAFPPSNDTLLSQLLSCRNRGYVSRGLLLREMDAQRAENPRWRAPDLGRGRSFEYVCQVECCALTQYWTDFLTCFPYFKYCAAPPLLTKHFLVIWLKLEEVLATVAHGRIDKEVCLPDYETTMPVTYEGLYAFSARHCTMWFGDPATLATLTLENASEVLRISRKVRRASLDDLEVTAVIQFLMAYYEREMFLDDAVLKKFVNQVLRELHDHYKSTYYSYHERLGEIVAIVGEFHRVISVNERYNLMMSMCTRSGQGMQLPYQKDAVNTLGDLRHSVKM